MELQVRSGHLQDDIQQHGRLAFQGNGCTPVQGLFGQGTPAQSSSHSTVLPVARQNIPSADGPSCCRTASSSCRRCTRTVAWLRSCLPTARAGSLPHTLLFAGGEEPCTPSPDLLGAGIHHLPRADRSGLASLGLSNQHGDTHSISEHRSTAGRRLPFLPKFTW